MKFEQSKNLMPHAHRLIPGGCHTYAKGDDQFPQLAPAFISHGKGSHVWDIDGNEFIEYGNGCRAVSLGHAFEPVISAVRAELGNGVNFSRAAKIEVDCAEALLGLIQNADMCKFAKNGSDVTTAAHKLARGITGRNMVAYCQDQPFFSIDDWFIGTTKFNHGIPDEIQAMSVGFRYDDPDSLERVFQKHPDQIACVILEAAKYTEPSANYLLEVQQLCKSYGALFILDEMITGFRWHNRGAQHVYGLEPDLSTFGKALANGFSVSALLGKREHMEIGGLYHDRERLFLLSTTHGAETHALAAAIATIEFYQNNPVIETLDSIGTSLQRNLDRVIAERELDDYVKVIGRPSNLVFGTRDREGQPCQLMRALLMQELIRHGVLGTSLVVCYSHSQEDVLATSKAFEQALDVYQKALEGQVEDYLVGHPTQMVYRKLNGKGFGKVDFPAFPP